MGELRYSDAAQASAQAKGADSLRRGNNSNGIIGRPSLLTLEGGLHATALGFVLGPVAYGVNSLLTGQSVNPQTLQTLYSNVLNTMSIGAITGYVVGHIGTYIAKETVGRILFGNRRRQ